jgi:glutathione S-transferase
MLTVYGNPLSTCTRKVLCLLAEKDAAFEFAVIDFTRGEHRTSAYLARQPFGQVPAIDHDGFALYESRAICRYLDEAFDGPKLIPGDARQRAVVEQWISVESANFTPHAMKILYQLFFGPMRGQTPDAKVIEAARTTLGHTLSIMETQLVKTEYLAGSTFTLADLVYLPYIEYLFACGQGDLITGHPLVGAWWSRCSARPSWLTATGKA